MIHRPRLLILLALGTVLAGCGGRQDIDEEQAGEAEASVQLAAAEQRAIDEQVLAWGVVELVPQRLRSVVVQSESQVADVRVMDGQPVGEGEELLRLTASAATRLEADAARRDEALAQEELARQGRLNASGLATNADLRTAQAAAAGATELRASLEARVGQAQGRSVPAPAAGIVTELSARPGDILAPGTIVARIADPAAVQVRLGIEPADAARIAAGQAVRLESLAQGTHAGGVVSLVDPRIDPQTRLATAWVRFTQPGTYPTGASVRARVIIATHRDAIVVPRSAVSYPEGQPTLFVADGDHAARRAVKAGLQDDTGIEILDGLAAGEQIVVLGNDQLGDGMQIRRESAASGDAE